MLGTDSGREYYLEPLRTCYNCITVSRVCSDSKCQTAVDRYLLSRPPVLETTYFWLVFGCKHFSCNASIRVQT